MYQVNDIGMIRERRQALLAEAEEARLARRLKEARPKRESYSGKMRRRAALLLSMVGLVVVLLAGAAYALDVECPPSVGGAACFGTDANRSLTSSKKEDMTEEQHSTGRPKPSRQALGRPPGGATMIMTRVGQRPASSTPFGLSPSTSAQIAEAANLNERYVREWLAAMSVGKIVEYDPEDETYHLPPEHAAWLTRAASPNNFAVTAQFIPLISSVEDGIVESFRNGGGLPYSAFPRFHEAMAEHSGQTVVATLTDHILPLVPGLTGRLEEGIDVLDVGSGSGRALNHLARTFPNSRFVGYDLSKEAIAHARAEATEHGTTNVRFEVKDATVLDEKASYDLITSFDAIHDQAHPAAVLRGVAEALRDDGVYLMQDIAGSSHVHKNMDHLIGTYLYTVSTMHCMTVSLPRAARDSGRCGARRRRRTCWRSRLCKRGGRATPARPLQQLLIVTKG